MATARGLPEAALHRNGGAVSEDHPPALFSQPFVEVLGLALEEGHLSMRRAATLLDLTIDDIADLFAAHGVALPSSLREE